MSDEFSKFQKKQDELLDKILPLLESSDDDVVILVAGRVLTQFLMRSPDPRATTVKMCATLTRLVDERLSRDAANNISDG